ncbi:MAG TPA: ABC transporter permease subunit [Xanthobacteraceae bacterium]|nr:ABC transporter permease subunit [Xanthobacteraceae bacterium]
MSMAAVPPRRDLRRFGDAALLLVAATLAWQALYAFVGDVAITPPLATVENAAALLRSPLFWTHVSTTALAFAVSLAIGAVAGVAAGLALGFHRFSGQVAEPILTALYTLPKVTLYPIVLLVFGLGISAKIAFGVMHGVIPVILITLNAVRNIDPVHLKTARVLNLTPGETALTVLAPAVTPEIFTGLRIGFGLTLLGVIIGEMFASQRGLGFMIINGINMHDVPTMMAVILLIMIFAVVASTALLAVDRRLHRRNS